MHHLTTVEREVEKRANIRPLKCKNQGNENVKILNLLAY